MLLELTSDQVEFFHKNGYLLIPNFYNKDTVDKMKARMQEIVRNFDITENQTVFTTGADQTAHADDYFLTSGDKIRFFWEEHAWKTSTDPVTGTITKTMVNSPQESINKVGHALHDLDSVFQESSYDPCLGRILRDLGMVKPVIAQSMYIFKQPRIGGDVCPHQDGSYLFTTPQSVIGMWWALDKCTVDNGCLWAVPGSHTNGVERQYRRVTEESVVTTKTEYYPPEKEKFDLTGAVPLEIDAGTMVVLHHALVHYSEHNSSDNQRHAYTIHVVDGREGCVYAENNWLQRPGMPFKEIPC